MRTAEAAYNQTVNMLDGSVEFVLAKLDEHIDRRIKEGAFFYEMKLTKETIEPQFTIMYSRFLHKLADLKYQVKSSSDGKSSTLIISWDRHSI